MKYFLNVLIATVLLSGAAISQTSPTRNDSSVIANKDLRKAALLIEQGKRSLAEIKLWQKENELLYQRIDNKDSVIKSQETNATLLQSMISNYKLEVTNLLQQSAIKDQLIKQAEKKFKKQKRKTVFTAILGVFGMGATAYLLTK